MARRSQRHDHRIRGDSRAPVGLGISLLVVAGLVLYWGSLQSPLVFDDRLFRSGAIYHFGASWLDFGTRWIAYATFGWTYRLFGEDLLWYRLGNVLLHAAVASALFLLLARLFEATLGASRGTAALGARETGWIAFFCAAIFLVHPVAVYGVAYLVERPIEMATLFSLVCLRLFLEGLLRRSLPWYVAAAAAYFLAVFSKEHSVMLPAVALALALLVRRPSMKLARELAIPFALFAAIAALITWKMRAHIGVPFEPLMAGPAQAPSAAGTTPNASFALSVVNQGFLFFRYLATWLVPYTGWMSIDLRPAFPAGLLAWPQTLGFVAWLAYPLCALALLAKRGRLGLLGFGLLYPWLLALTEVVTVRVQEPFVLYRSYLWMSGLFAGLPALVLCLRPAWRLPVLGAVCLALILPMRDRIDSFSSDLKVWDDVVRKSGGATGALVERGYHNRGIAYLNEGRYLEALRDFDKALELNPADTSALLGRGTLHMRTGSRSGALADLDRAIELDPRFASAYGQRCALRMERDQLGEALADCEKAVAIEPAYRDAYTNLGVILARRGERAQAEARFRRALELDVRDREANYNFGVLLLELGRRDEAERFLATACAAGAVAACNLAAKIRAAP